MSDGSLLSGIVVPALIVLLAIVVCVGASNIINFMDGINGITGGYALASLIPLFILNRELGFVEDSLVVTVVLADVVFCLFNFRPKGKAKCFAGDVGSIGIAFILLFLIGRLVMLFGDWMKNIRKYCFERGCSLKNKRPWYRTSCRKIISLI